jgi:CheY-like chemotaxis protein
METLPFNLIEMTERMKILLAEDNALGREMLSSCIEELGFSCTAANNGLEAVELAGQQKFDLVIMDIEMPLLNGYQAAEKIRAAGLTMPILALTAHHSEEQHAKCIAAGMNSSLTKPIDKNALEQAIAILVPGIKLRAQENEFYTEATGGVINLAFLSKISKGRKDFFMSMIDIFLEQNTTDLLTLKNAIGNSDFDGVRLLAHKIRTSVSFIGLEQVQEQLQEMELLGEQKMNIERTHQLYCDVVAVCAEAEKELEQVRGKAELI